MTLTVALLVAAATALASFALTGLAVRVLSARAVLDRPNERSSHARPTPRGAGLAVVAALVPALLAAEAAAGEGLSLWPVLIGLAFLAGISFLDDLKGLGAGVRLIAQGGAVALGLLALPDGAVTQGLLPFWADRVLVAIGWLWFVNLFNFMDGIDGIAAVETIAVGIGVACVSSARRPPRRSSAPDWPPPGRPRASCPGTGTAPGFSSATSAASRSASCSASCCCRLPRKGFGRRPSSCRCIISSTPPSPCCAGSCAANGLGRPTASIGTRRPRRHRGTTR